MAGAVPSVLYAVVLVFAYASVHARQPGIVDQRRPIATIVALVVVGLPTLAQLTVAPSLLGDLRRDWAAIGSGQLWRLVTSLVVQDGGLLGALFNLVSLLVIGSAAEKAWGARRWVVLALGAGVGAQLWGWFVQPVGGATPSRCSGWRRR